MIFGLAKDKWKRKIYENEFRSQLLNYDVEVLMAWQELPKQEQMNRETVEKDFGDKNVDALLVTIKVGKVMIKRFTPVAQVMFMLVTTDSKPRLHHSTSIQII